MKVLHTYCGPFPSNQGTQTLIDQLCSATRRVGATPYIASYEYGISKSMSAFPLRLPGYHGRQSYQSGPWPGRIMRDTLMPGHIRRQIFKHGIDLIHAHHYEALLASKIATAGLSEVPVVFHQHALLAPELKLYPGMRFVPGVDTLSRIADAVLPALADYTICINTYNYKQLPSSFIQANRASILQPIPFGNAPRRISPTDADCIRGVYLGNLDAYQNLDALWAAMDQLSWSTRDRFSLTVITDAPENALPDHVTDRIRYIHHGPYDAVHEILQQSDLVIVPRRTPGGMPIKLFNALAAGVPVIGHQSVCSVPDKQMVYLLSDTDAASLAGAIAHLCEHPGEIDEMKSCIARHLNVDQLRRQHDAQLSNIYECAMTRAFE